MSKYDVFIRGIRPERIDEAAVIKKKASQFLKIDEDKLEELWNKPSGLCIRRKVLSEEAEQIQSSLAKAGLICIYKPALAGLTLAIEEEKEESVRLFTCPGCGHQETLEKDEPEPIKCSKCFINIAKYNEKTRQEQEKQEIRKRLLQTKSLADIRNDKQREEEEEKKRKKQLEDEIADELFGTRRKKRLKIMISAACAGFVLLVSGAVYSYLGSHNKNLTFTITGDAFPTVAMTDKDEWQHSLQTGRELNGSEQELSPGQMALQDNFNKANKVLNAFGLDARALAGNSGKRSGRLIPVTPGSVTPPTATTATAVQTGGISGTNQLLQAGETSQQWDLYLVQNIDRLISRKSYADAIKLAQYISDPEMYINVLGQLLAFVRQAKQPALATEIITDLQTKINNLAATEQPGFFAQAGLYEYKVLGSDTFFNRADTISQQLSKAEDQLSAMVKMGVYTFKAGMTEKANQYFGKINNLVDKISSVDNQVIGYANIAKAWHDVGDDVNAANWLADTDRLVSQIKPETRRLLIETYAYINQFQQSLTNDIADDKKAESLYTAVKASLKSNLINNAQTINESISDPAYKTLGLDLISSYDSGNAAQYLSQAEKTLPTIASPFDKAIAASRISRQYANNSNTEKAVELQKLVEQQIEALPESPLKDEVIAVAAKNYAQYMQFEAANKLAAEIKSPSLRSEINNDIIHLKAVQGLLGS